MKLRAVLMGGAYLVAGAFVFAAGGAAGIYADQAYPDVVPYLAHHQVGRGDTTEPDQATALIQGANGTSVTLTIQRGTSTFDVTLVRTEIQIPSVRSTQLPGHILYVRIYSFGSSTSADFAAALNDGLKGAKGVVLDL